jgi:hypothetical protein
MEIRMAMRKRTRSPGRIVISAQAKPARAGATKRFAMKNQSGKPSAKCLAASGNTPVASKQIQQMNTENAANASHMFLFNFGTAAS